MWSYSGNHSIHSSACLPFVTHSSQFKSTKQVCELLLKFGASINTYNPAGELGTALFNACAHAQVTTANWLLQRGARLIQQLNAANPNQPFPMTELTVVCRNGADNALELIELLLKYGL